MQFLFLRFSEMNAAGIRVDNRVRNQIYRIIEKFAPEKRRDNLKKLTLLAGSCFVTIHFTHWV